MRLCFFSLVAGVGLAFSSPCEFDEGSAQANAGSYIVNLERSYWGYFIFENWPDEVQAVGIELDEVVFDANARLVAGGREYYQIGHRAALIDIRIEVDPATRRFELWEIGRHGAGEGKLGADGSHVGHVSSDRRSIRLQWTADTTDYTGEFHLEASDFSEQTIGRRLRLGVSDVQSAGTSARTPPGR